MLASSGAKQGFLAPSVTMDRIYGVTALEFNTKLHYLASWTLSIAEFSHCMTLFSRLCNSGAKSWHHGDGLTVASSLVTKFVATGELESKSPC
jgi:hypothetical protein